KDDRTVAQAPSGAAITASDEPIDLLRCKACRQCRQPPMGQARNRLLEAQSTQASEAEIPQEGPHRRDEVFGSSFPTLIGSIEEERPYSLCVPFAGILAKGLEYRRGAPAVMRHPRLHYRPG